MTRRAELLDSIATTIADYREGEIPRPTPGHVDRWASQFANDVQIPLLAEIDHVLKRTYLTRAKVEKFLGEAIPEETLVGQTPGDFWHRANFLDIQGGGNSQRDMLRMFDRQLQAQCGFTTAACGSDDGPFIYLDDIVFTGNRVKNDLAAWIDSSAPQEATLHVVVLALHRAGWDYADDELRAISRTARKRIDIKWWRDIEVEDRGSCSQQSDVLRPATIPDDPDTQEYISGLVYNGQWYPPVPRSGTSIGENKFFSSHDGRCLLEQQFLRTRAFESDVKITACSRVSDHSDSRNSSHSVSAH